MAFSLLISKSITCFTARALSTHFSTASLDKHPQSTERGITLDLGFSSFLAPVPDDFSHIPYDQVQFTLVDCPGHASLIKTVLGAAHIIDMMILVIDVNKGIQTQTAECLVVGEIASNELLVVLNKTDMIPESTRNGIVEKMRKRIMNTLKATKFKDVHIIPIAARPGGSDSMSSCGPPPEGMSAVMTSLSSRVTEASLRKKSGNFLFAVDHCFPIKGQGTVLTGTVLSGECSIGDLVELPTLGLTKKIKSMQMFKRSVQRCAQGDRLGMCFTQLDHKMMERGIVASPGTVPSFDAAIVTADKIRFHRGTILSKTKFHITFGHCTVMATVEFFCQSSAVSEVKSTSEMLRQSKFPNETCEISSPIDVCSQTFSGFHEDKEYNYCEELWSEETNNFSDKRSGPTGRRAYSECTSPREVPESPYFALLRFDRQVTCPNGTPYMASRFDSDFNQNTCRLAFHGCLARPLNLDHDPNELRCMKVFKLKEREGTVDRVIDTHYAIGRGMFKKETDLTLFQGMKVITSHGEEGVIEGAFGKSGKFKLYFKDGICTMENNASVIRLYLRFKRLSFDKESKRMFQ